MGGRLEMRRSGIATRSSDGNKILVETRRKAWSGSEFTHPPSGMVCDCCKYNYRAFQPDMQVPQVLMAIRSAQCMDGVTPGLPGSGSELISSHNKGFCNHQQWTLSNGG